MKICRQQDPPDFAPLDGNRAACWLHDERAALQRARYDAAVKEQA